MLDGILSISGQPGLFKVVSQTKNGIIVESLETKKRFPTYTSSKVSALSDIAIFTSEEEVPLADVFKKIFTVENKGKSSVTKASSDSEIKEYFEDILPTYDKDRVYVSDMKKVLTWYNVLLSHDLIVLEEKTETTEAVNDTKSDIETKTDAVIAKKVKAKAAPKTTAVTKVKSDAVKPKQARAPKTIQRKAQ